MRILWLSPMHKGSAIARFSELIVDQLSARGYDVTLGRSEAQFEADDRRDFLGLPVKPASFHLANSDAFDVVIANFGDHYPNHKHCLDALGLPCLVGIFHDADLTNFGNGMRAAGFSSPLFSNAWEDGPSLTARLAGCCAGSVAHSDFYRRTIDACDGPIAVIPLAWALADRPSIRAATLRGDQNKLRLITVGNINSNKCVDRVIDAIAANANLRNAVQYRLVGGVAPEMEDDLKRRAGASGVDLVVLGAVSDDQLCREFAAASLVSCLREPVLEGGSASAVEAMLHGCVMMVSDAGFYADLPEDCVIKVPEATTSASIGIVLEQALRMEPAALATFGQRARAFAEQQFSPARYADRLAELAAEARIVSAYFPLIQRLGAQLTNLGLSRGSPATECLLNSIESMIPASRREPDDDGDRYAAKANVTTCGL